MPIDGTSPFFYTIAGQKGPLRLAEGGLDTKRYNAFIYDSQGVHKHTIDFKMNGVPRALAWPQSDSSRFAVLPSVYDEPYFLPANLRYEKVFGAPVEVFLSKPATQAGYQTLAPGELQAGGYRLGSTFGPHDVMKVTQDLRFATLNNPATKQFCYYDMAKSRRIGSIGGIDDAVVSADGAKIAWSKNDKLGIASFPPTRQGYGMSNIKPPTFANSLHSLTGLSWLGAGSTDLAFRQTPQLGEEYFAVPAPLIARVI